MIGLILAGGKGTRIAKDIEYPSKVLIPIADRSLIQRNIDCLVPFVSEIFIVVGESGDAIRQELSKIKQVRPITFIDKEDAQNPLEGMKKAVPYVKENVLMALGDEILISGHIGGLSDNAHEKHSDISLAIIPDATEDEIAQTYSLEYDDNGYVVNLVEKPTSFPNKDRGTGYYYISHEVFSQLPYVEGKNIVDLFLYAIAHGFKATSYVVAYQAYNINTIEELNKVKRYFK